MDIYQRIKYLAEKKRIQQKEISEALNVTTATVNNWFQGKTSMKAEQIPLIAKLLRVSIEELFTEETHPKTYKGPEVKLDVAEDGCAICREKEKRIALLEKHIELLEFNLGKSRGTGSK